MRNYTGLEIAIVGLSGKFPGAEDVSEFWNNIKNGKEGIRFFSEEELLQEGEDASLLANPSYVKANGYLENKEFFDSEFFNYRPDEAHLMDPQTRIFHEVVWEALENAGCDLSDNQKKVGLFAGASSNVNWEIYSQLANREGLVDNFSASQLSNARFMGTKISYFLNLKGPSVFVDTACSTSLVTIQMACRSLLLNECNVAVAGGVTITNRSKKGYVYREGMILSQDGHCRSFDAKASGTVGGEGAGVVVLKTLKNALKEGDHIWGLVIGAGINNDGNSKVGYTAPSIDGQTEAILIAQKWAKVEPESISLVEAHGTATKLGDPIEVEALNRAFGKSSQKYCALGSVKSNIGHLDIAAGVAGFIKATMALKNKQLPPSINYTAPNPEINFDNSPFYINTELKDWDAPKYPRRAGVSSFGIGGTNVHLILEEAPEQESTSRGRDAQVLLFSAKTSQALQRYMKNFSRHLESNPETALADIAYTLQTGRSTFEYRKAIVCSDHQHAIELLKAEDGICSCPENIKNQIVFMFTGAGSQYVNMYRDLYIKEAVFSDEVDKCFEIAKKISGKDFKSIIYPNDSETDKINEIENTQPALFILEYALAKLLVAWGIRPSQVIGHSFGEYVAACIADAISLEDALFLIIRRSELMYKAPAGGMMSITITEEELRYRLEQSPQVSLAAVNSSELCVVSGKMIAIVEFKDKMEREGYQCKVLQVMVAGHSYLMDSILRDFELTVSKVSFQRPLLPVFSNLYGREITYEEIVSPQYWSNQLRSTVQFAKGIESIFAKRKNVVFLEVGPSNVLSTFVRSNKFREKDHSVINLVRHPLETEDDQVFLFKGIAELWQRGIVPNWSAFYEKEHRRKIVLPTYSFEKIKFPVNVDAAKMISNTYLQPREDMSEWFHVPAWETTPLCYPKDEESSHVRTIIFMDKFDIGKTLVSQLDTENKKVICVFQGSGFKQLSDSSYEISPSSESDFIRVIEIAQINDRCRIIFGWCINKTASEQLTIEKLEESLSKGFFALLNLVKAIREASVTVPVELIALTNDLQGVLKADRTSPEKSILLGALRVIPKEYENIQCRSVDFVFNEKGETLTNLLVAEMRSCSADQFVAYRYESRFTQQIRQQPIVDSKMSFRENGVYLASGAAGSMSLTFVKKAIQQVKGIKLILLGTLDLPEKTNWKDWLSQNRASDNGIRKTIQDLLSIEKEGGTVHYLRVDLSDEHQLKQEILRVEEKTGKINGVIYSAECVDTEGTIFEWTKNAGEKVFAAKLQGTIILNKVLQDHTLDFFVLNSSSDSLFAPIGKVASAAVNMFLDYFSVYNARVNGIATVSIGWNSLTDIDKVGRGVGAKAAFWDRLTPDEGFAVLLRAIRSSREVLLISKGNVSKLLTTGERAEVDPEKIQEEVLGESGTSTSIIQTRLLEFWVKFFGKSNISYDTNFFELGGDSLKALTLIGRIYKAFSIRLTVADFFKRPTLRELGKYIGALQDKNTTRYNSIEMLERPSRVRLSFSQDRLWFIHQLEGSTQYHIPIVLELKGKVNPEAIQFAFGSIVNRHEILRTVIFQEEGNAFQRALEEDLWKLDFVHETQHHNHAQDFKQKISELIHAPFDLSSDHTLRASLITISSQESLLVLTLHHIASDGWSIGIVIREFVELYNAFVLDRSHALPALTLQYPDYAVWQRTHLDGELLAGKLAYWKKQLTGVQPINLPTDFQRPLIQSSRGSTIHFSVDQELTEKLQEISQRGGVTMFMTLITTFKILLYRYSGQDDICVGSPTANRSQYELEDLIGFFVNTLVLRSQLTHELTFLDLLQQVKTMTLEAYENQDVPFEKIVEAVVNGRDLSRNPLFQVMFVFQNTPAELSEDNLEGLQLKSVDGGYSSSKFDISLTIGESPTGLKGDIEYNTDLFAEATIVRIAQHFKQLLFAVVNSPASKIHQLELLSDEEKHQLINEFNDTTIEGLSKNLLIDFFEEQVRNVPDNVAVIYEDQRFTYAELNSQSNRLARHLVDLGVGKGSLVPICIERGIDMVVGMLSILKSGAAYVPIDPDYPLDRVLYMLNDVSPDFVMVSSVTVEMLPDDANWKYVDIKTCRNIAIESTDLGLRINPDDLAYVIYTSGSTGHPKGAEIMHGNAGEFIAWCRREFNPLHFDIVFSGTSYCFDLSVFEIFFTLSVGKPILILKSGLEIARHLVGYHNVLINTVPSVVDAMLRQRENFSNVSVLNMAGESIPYHIKEELDFNRIQIRNLYGPTEDTTYSSCYRINDAFDFIPIGKPISNTQFYILDKFMQFVPIGVPGEIFIAGAGLARGYLNKSQLTLEKFIDNPFNRGAKLYKTGDVGRWLPDGNIQYLGRMDFQVKINGFRIELEEVEYVLRDYEFIREVAVRSRIDSQGANRLIAYVVPSDKFNKDELIAHVRQTLPEYMIPFDFMMLESMPLNANGKLDRKKLPEYQIQTERERVSPSTVIEKGLVKIWSEILEIQSDGISVNQSFFELGGHSLRAINVLSKIEKEFNTLIPLVIFFRGPTIQELAKHIVVTSLSKKPIRETKKIAI